MTQFTYVEMQCELTEDRYPDGLIDKGIRVASLQLIDENELYACYLKAFEAGDAQFFKLQDEAERRRFYDEDLGFPMVLDCPASFALTRDDTLIGFALVMPYLVANYHISCMCVLPEYQNQGIGADMLKRIKTIAVAKGCRSLTLGTEPTMKAYHLYLKHSFVVTETHTISQ